MKAILFEELGRLALTQAEPPALNGPDEILIRVAAVGICGSEIHAFSGTHPFRKPPAIMGHEVTGDVLQVGPGVRRFAPGDRVFVDPQWTCGRCQWCRSRRHNLCPTKQVLGTRTWSGGLGEFIVAPERSVYHLPPSISYVTGTLIEPLSVAVHAVQRAQIASGESVLVLGCGPIGMLVVGVAKSRGASPVIAVDLQPHCLDTARDRFGADHTALGSQAPLVDALLELTNGAPIDAVFLTAGVSRLVRDALRLVKSGGRVLFLALFDEPVQFDPFEIVGRDVALIGSQMYNEADIQAAINLIATGALPVDAMVTHVLPLEEAARGFDIAATKRDGAIKVVLQH